MKINVIPAHRVRIYESVGRYFVRCSVCGRLGRSYETKAEAFNRKKAHVHGTDC